METLNTVVTNTSKLDKVINCVSSPVGMAVSATVVVGTGLYFFGRHKAKKAAAEREAQLVSLQQQIAALKAKEAPEATAAK